MDDHVRVISDEGRTAPRPWTLLLFRIAVCLMALMTFAQAVLAGGFLGGQTDMLTLHGTNATVVVAMALLMAISGVLVWRPGGGPAWPAVVGLGVLAAVTVQAFLGYGHARGVHVPLGIAVTVALLLLVVRVWLPVPREREDAFTPPARTPLGR